MRQEQSERLAASIVEFGRFLRMRGLSTDTSQTITALEAVKTIDATDRQFFAFALQATLCSTREEWELFPQLFRSSGANRNPGRGLPPVSTRDHSESKASEREEGSAVFLDQPGNGGAEQDGKGKAVYGASAQQRLKKVDFSEVPYDDLRPWKNSPCDFCGG